MVFARKWNGKKQSAAFQEFCRRCPLPDLKDETLKEVTNRFEETFGRDLIDFAVNEKDGTLNVELNVPNGPLVSSIELNDIPLKEEDIEPEVKVKFIPFPVALPGDPELVWMMAKRETMSPDEAARALTRSTGRVLGIQKRTTSVAQRG
jgi:hypothetical protein